MNLYDRIDKLESQLFEHTSPLTHDEVNRIVAQGRAEGLSEAGIITRMEERDPAAAARGFLMPTEYCGVCSPGSPVGDMRAQVDDSLQRLVFHVEANALCIVTIRGEDRLPIDTPTDWRPTSPLFLAALSHLVDDPNMWRSFWSLEDDYRPNNLTDFYMASAQEQVDAWRDEDAERAEKLEGKIAERIADIKAIPDPLAEFRLHKEAVA